MFFQKRIPLTRHILTWVGICLAFCSCDGIGKDIWMEDIQTKGEGVIILCEGNFNSGNASLSYYNTQTREVEQNVFQRVNDRRLGDTGQSITLHEGTAFIAMENSGIIWKIDARTFRVLGQLTDGETEHMVDPRYVHIVSPGKAYATDLYSPFITVFNPQSMQYIKSISTEQAMTNGFASTEEMVQVGDEVFTNCWSFSRNILVIDTRQDCVVDSIVLDSWQPKSMAVDANERLWVITDGGSSTGKKPKDEAMQAGGTLQTGKARLYRINPHTRQIELSLVLPESESMAQLALDPARHTLYILNNDIYQMSIDATALPSQPFLYAPVDEDGKRHHLYGIDVNPKNGEIYVADAVDYSQAGVVYRYSPQGQLIHSFRVGIIPNHFAFIAGETDITPGTGEGNEEGLRQLRLVDRVFEFMPAPGHQVNGFNVVGDAFAPGLTMEEACDTVLSHFRKQWMVSLGAQGGYLVAGFDQPVRNTGDYELAIKGNPFSYQSEPGIIWVSMDENGDGQPNDTWYELAGSEFGTENETLDYAITYYKPTTPKSDIRWTDNQSGEGIVPYMESWNAHDSYWQDWVPTEPSPEGSPEPECRTYYGSRLKDTHTYQNGASFLPAFAWGYADNDGRDYFRNRDVDCAVALGYYKISNAVCPDGSHANLPFIHFVKVQTAQTGWTPNLGEISTEIYGIWKVE